MSDFGKGIPTAVGFDVGAQKPVDSRITAKTLAERDAHITENRAYVGLTVYVEENGLTYQYNGVDWIILATQDYVDKKIEDSVIDVSQIDLSSYVSKEEFEQTHVPLSSGELDALIDDIFKE